MIVFPENKDDDKIPYTLKCAICRAKITSDDISYQSTFLFSIVCQNCYHKFSNEDLEMMINIFFTFGGYFGKYKDKDFIVDAFVKKTINEIRSCNKEVTLQDLTLKLMHQALLHGITPQQFLEKLKDYFRL